MPKLISIHEDNYSLAPLIINSEVITEYKSNDLVQLIQNDQEGKPHSLLLPITIQETSANTQFSFSVNRFVAESFGFNARETADLVRADAKDHYADFLELSIRDQYLARSGMWRIKEELLGKCVFTGLKTSAIGGIKIKIDSAVISKNTKVVYRSDSAKLFMLLQMSQEIWTFDQNGDYYEDKMVREFLPELFKRWTEANTCHVVSVVLFGRFFLSNAEKSKSFNVDHLGRQYKDIFQVVLDSETLSNWDQSLVQIKKAIKEFRHNLKSFKDGHLSLAADGNILESFNLAMNKFGRHYIDRDLLKTGLSAIVVTASNGELNVDRMLHCLTKQKMIDDGIFLHLVCLTPKPFFKTPLLHFNTKIAGKKDKTFPHWLSCSYVQEDFDESSMLRFNVNLESDEQIPKIPTHQLPLLELSPQNLARKIESLSMNTPKSIQQSKNTERFRKSTKIGLNRRRWILLSPETGNIRWDFLVSPPCMPIETDYFPKQFLSNQNYNEYNYVLYAKEDDSMRSPSGLSKCDVLLKELIAQRLSQGFQLVLQSEPEHQTYYFSLGYDFHKIQKLSDSNIAVKRYSWNQAALDPIEYNCAILPKNGVEYIECNFKLYYPSISDYNWNYSDNLLAGYETEMNDELRFWRTRFILIPAEIPIRSQVLLKPSKENLDDEELRVEGFFKFIQTLEKSAIDISKKRLNDFDNSIKVHLTTLNYATFVARSNDSLGNRKPRKPTKKMTRQTKFDQIISEMQNEETGVNIKNRRWHLTVHKNVFIGSEFIDWILDNFSDIETREAAMEYGDYLLSKNVIEHVFDIHGFLDGYYYYKFSKKYKAGKKWFQRAKQPRSLLEMSRAFFIDADTSNKSSSSEWAVIHYDTIHNPKLCYHFQLHWLVCTSKFLDDLIQMWIRRAHYFGFNLVEAPVQQLTYNDNENPFQKPIRIAFALRPPDSKEINKKLKLLTIPATYFEEELLKRKGFFLDIARVEFTQVKDSFKRPKYEKTQYVHKSGMSFVQIDEFGLLWVENPLVKSRLKANNNEIYSDLKNFCSNENLIKTMWNELLQGLCTKSGIDMILEDEWLDSSDEETSTKTKAIDIPSGIKDEMEETITGFISK